jgi:hypothetical protein
VSESQSLSSDAVTASLPSGENATAWTESEWPSTVLRVLGTFIQHFLHILTCRAALHRLSERFELGIVF